MIKAVFIDYTGTTVYQTGKEMDEIVSLVQNHSTMTEEKEVLKFFYTTRVEKEEKYYLDSYRSEDKIIDEQLDMLHQQYQFNYDHDKIKKLVHQFWSNTPVYEDAKQFFKQCPLPVYVLTNNGTEFVSATLKAHDIHCAGIISSDDVKAYKPKRELFDYALVLSGCSHDEVIHIGDSYFNDVEGAKNAGIIPVWIQREKQSLKEDILCVQSLPEVLKILKLLDDKKV